MDVIRHNHIAADGYVVLLCFEIEFAKCLVDFVSGQHASAIVCIERDEIKRPDIMKQSLESRRPSRPFRYVVVRHS